MIITVCHPVCTFHTCGKCRGVSYLEAVKSVCMCLCYCIYVFIHWLCVQNKKYMEKLIESNVCVHARERKSESNSNICVGACICVSASVRVFLVSGGRACERKCRHI